MTGSPAPQTISVGEQPILHTNRLTLRPFRLDDAPMVQALAGVHAVADTTMNIPHPYPDGLAEQWIGTHRAAWEGRAHATYAITDRSTGSLIGAVGLTLSLAHVRGELGYWIGQPFWNRGYCTEAARALVDFGFGPLQLHRIQSRHFTRNPASGRVMQKLEMKFEGINRGSMRKGDRFEDVAFYAILAADRAV